MKITFEAGIENIESEAQFFSAWKVGPLNEHLKIEWKSPSLIFCTFFGRKHVNKNSFSLSTSWQLGDFYCWEENSANQHCRGGRASLLRGVRDVLGCSTREAYELLAKGGSAVRCDIRMLGWCMGVSKNCGTPKSSILIGFFRYKPSILGYPYFWKHLYVVLSYDENTLQRDSFESFLPQQFSKRTSSSFPTSNFQVQAVSFREDTTLKKNKGLGPCSTWEVL